MKKIEEMDLKELVEFWNKDWEREEPELEDISTMRSWERRVEGLLLGATELELLQFLHDMGDSEMEQLEIGRRLLFIEPLDDRIKALETSIKVLLKEHEDEPTKMTIGQLNRLKGGIR